MGESPCVGHGEAGVRRAEFGSSGEDSFVAVVVTKLTGALLFILLLTMVIMALLPKAVDLENGKTHGSKRTRPEGRAPLRIATPPQLPEAIAGRPYLLALAATGGRGPLSWSVQGACPRWLHPRPGGRPDRRYVLPGTNGRTPGSRLRVSDGDETASQPQPTAGLTLPPAAPHGDRL